MRVCSGREELETEREGRSAETVPVMVHASHENKAVVMRPFLSAPSSFVVLSERYPQRTLDAVKLVLTDLVGRSV